MPRSFGARGAGGVTAEDADSCIRGIKLSIFCNINGILNASVRSGCRHRAPQTGQLRQQKYIVSQSGRWTPNSRASAGLISREASLLGLWTALSLLGPARQRERGLGSPLIFRRAQVLLDPTQSRP